MPTIHARSESTKCSGSGGGIQCKSSWNHNRRINQCGIVPLLCVRRRTCGEDVEKSNGVLSTTPQPGAYSCRSSTPAPTTATNSADITRVRCHCCHKIDGHRRSTFAVPLQRRLDPGVCAWCDNTRVIPCETCQGTGYLHRSGGYHAKNQVHLSRVVGTNWTGLERTLGWRHFSVKQKMKIGKTIYLLLVATCDDTARLWVPVDVLKSRQLWAAGWLQKQELKALMDGGQEQKGIPCPECSSSGCVQCSYCVRDTEVLIEL